ncbi:YadA C-terminal domain-containing protein [Acinetobacter radioresistens]|nr:YadA C-terminal domain-containing protein [Acinetobacter radioresistens]MCU4568224.1 YadA C-terminal domain-containing protein [Acinetobacter radioresistens]
MINQVINEVISTAGLQGKNRVGVGAGLQGSEQAVAVGDQRIVDNNTSLSISGAFTRKESSAGVGADLSW